MSNEYDIKFDFIRFLKFLDNNNIVSTAIAAVLSDRVNEITNVFFDGLIMPIINRDADNDGVKDIKKFEEYEVSIFNIAFKPGIVILALVKFIIITYLLFLMTKIIEKYR